MSDWECAELCANCGEYLSYSIAQTHWGRPCNYCGAVGHVCPDTIKTSRRFITTTKRWFRPDLGHWEWSGKKEDGGDVPAEFMKGKSISPAVTIAAAGVASGLF